MARIRSIKPGFCTSEPINELSIPCELHFVKLWTYCDDHGRALDNPKLIKAAIWPLRDEVTFASVEEWQAELEVNGRIIRYEVGGRRYFQVVNWTEHQKPQHPKDSDFPEADSAIHESLRKPHEALPKSTLGEGEGVGEGEIHTRLKVVAKDDDSFERFWDSYPRRDGKRVGKAKALDVWRRLTAAERERATIGVAHYAASGWRAKDAERWLRDKAFDDWQEPATPDAEPDEPTPGYLKPYPA